MQEVPNRCRLILVADARECVPADVFEAATAADVASVILHQGAAGEHEYLEFCEKITPGLQDKDVAVLVADNTQVFGRTGADGLFLEKEKAALEDVIARFSPQNIVGCGGFKTRHGALQAGELKPDFVFFGKLGGDIRPEPHPKNLALAEWWAELVEIPGVVMGGDKPQSVIECAASGADFVALAKAVFAGQQSPAHAVLKANELLDAHAPEFVGDEA